MRSKQINKQLINRLVQTCIREELLEFTLCNDLLVIPLKENDKTLIVTHVQAFNLGKFELKGDVLVIDRQQVTPIEKVADLLALMHIELQQQCHPQQWEQFVLEINNCTNNELLCADFIANTQQTLSGHIARQKNNSLLDFLSHQYDANEQLKFFEKWATRGHPYHPCHKTKLGFSNEDYLKFSPEFHNDILLPVAAIAKSIMHLEKDSVDFDYHSWFANQFPEIWSSYCKRLTSLDKPIIDFYPIFIHPWQYAHVITRLFAKEVSQNNIIFFEDIAISTKASLSFRTLMVENNAYAPHIKLPVAVQSTSAMRTISPASVENGPKISACLREILQRENYFQGHIFVAYERFGLHVKHTDVNLAKHLAIVYRDNPSCLLKTNESPVVVAALFEISPVSQLPLFIEIMQQACGTSFENAIAYFDHYSKLVIQAYLDLLLIYGIALEAHQQNTIAIFKDHLPQYMVARDLGGLRIHLPTLKEQGFLIEPFPNSATLTNDALEVTNKFLHTVIQYHLGELILLLARHYQKDENVFWPIIRKNLIERFNILKPRVSKQRFEQEYQAILNNDWQVKSFMRMRLNNVYSKYVYVQFKNPLRAA